MSPNDPRIGETALSFSFTIWLHADLWRNSADMVPTWREVPEKRRLENRSSLRL